MSAEPTTIEAGQVKQMPAVRDEPKQKIATWTPAFAVSVDDAVHTVELKNEFFKRVMVEGKHYGKVPGSDKPTLLKPGAELLLSNMGLRPVLTDENPPILDITGADHVNAKGDNEPYIAYRRKCQIYRQTGPTEHERILIAEASGSCNSWEKKYRYRKGQRLCPVCNKATIIKGKQFDKKLAEQGVPGDWVCWKKEGKSDGCGAKFKHDSVEGRALAEQSVEDIPNPDVADLDNTILKMADKRAMVAACLLATGCSDIFTQDIEDRIPDDGRDDAPPSDDMPAETTPPVKETVVIPSLIAMRDMFLATGRSEPQWAPWVQVTAGLKPGDTTVTNAQKVAIFQALQKLEPVNGGKPPSLADQADQAGLPLG